MIFRNRHGLTLYGASISPFFDACQKNNVGRRQELPTAFRHISAWKHATLRRASMRRLVDQLFARLVDPSQ
jgi:hypothetical protein